MYRRRKAGKNGKLRDAGAYVIDMRIKRAPELAGIKPRLAKTTGVYPGHRNASTVVSEMKLMLKELIRERDAATLRQLQENKLSLPSLYKKWKQGRTHLAEPFEDQPVVKLWLRYLDQAVLAEKTKANRRAIVASLQAKELLTGQTVVNELPQVLARIRRYYEPKKQVSAFNTVRIEVRAFLTKGLGFETDSVLLRDVLRVPPLKQAKRREHHPFYSPLECVHFLTRLTKRATGQAKHYAASVLFMCMHGLRPHEFEGKCFVIDSETGHLRIAGTKNPNAQRLVPLQHKFVGEPPRVDTLNRLFERMGTDTRCRDFRRTYSIWCELAGIPNPRIQSYMGHADHTVTQTYQRTVPRHTTLDEDRKKMHEWWKAEIAKAPASRKRPGALSELGALRAVLNPQLGKLLFAMADQEANSAEFEGEEVD